MAIAAGPSEHRRGDGMSITPLEQTLIASARRHQEELARHYRKHQTGQVNDEEYTAYLKHSGALIELMSLNRPNSGLGAEAIEQMRQVAAEAAATFRLNFPDLAKQLEADFNPLAGQHNFF